MASTKHLVLGPIFPLLQALGQSDRDLAQHDVSHRRAASSCHWQRSDGPPKGNAY